MLKRFILVHLQKFDGFFENLISLENHDITYFSHLCLLRYIFFADKVEIKDITKQTCLFALAGPKSNQVRLFLKQTVL